MLRGREGDEQPVCVFAAIAAERAAIGRVGAMITYGTYGEIRSFAAVLRRPAGRTNG